MSKVKNIKLPYKLNFSLFLIHRSQVQGSITLYFHKSWLLFLIYVMNLKQFRRKYIIHCFICMCPPRISGRKLAIASFLPKKHILWLVAEHCLGRAYIITLMPGCRNAMPIHTPAALEKGTVSQFEPKKREVIKKSLHRLLAEGPRTSLWSISSIGFLFSRSLHRLYSKRDGKGRRRWRRRV